MAGTTRISLRLVSATALALALAACGQQRQASIDNSATAQNEQALGELPPLPEVQPLAEGPATPVRYAPPASRLPGTRPLGYAEAPQDDRYAWIDRANRISDTIGDAPPDYAFDYDGVEPWVWQTSNDYLTYAEPIDDGYRYYYYEPGADYPYLVRDPHYSYGYRDGRIATVYDRQGRYLAAAEAQRQAEAASRYYARARALRVAAREREGRGVAAAQWAARRPVIAAARNDWRDARQRVPDWQAYRQRHATEESRQFMPERAAREQAAQRFATWQRGGEAGRPPQLYGPNDRGNRRDDNRQIDQARQQAQRDVTQQRAAAEQQRRQQQAAAQQARDTGSAQADAQREAARQRAASEQRTVQERLQQQAARRDQARREHVTEPQRAADQPGPQVRQQAEQQRIQQRAAQQQQAQQRVAEQRGQQMRQQRDAQRQQAEQQRSAQRQQMQQREQAQQQAAQQRATQQAQQQAQRQAAQQRATPPRPQPGQGPGREHGNR